METKLLDKDRIVGCFLGVFIGDSMGKPVESWKPEKIAEIYGRLTTIVAPSNHKLFKGQPAGTWSDDTQLTLVVADALIEAGELTNLEKAMDFQAAAHVKALNEATDGWGGSTREAIRRVANGQHWAKSGQEMTNANGKPSGGGNGVAMKISPLAMYYAMNGSDVTSEVFDFAVALSQMTHKVSVSIHATLAILQALKDCFLATPKQMNQHKYREVLIEHVIAASQLGEALTDPEGGVGDNITVKLGTLKDYKQWDQKDIIASFGGSDGRTGGSCYAYDSIPFSLAWFLKDPNSIESMYNCINAGGDTDSNGSMVGAMLGALHGTSIFPDHLIQNLNPNQKRIVLDTADRFYEKFGK